MIRIILTTKKMIIQDWEWKFLGYDSSTVWEKFKCRLRREWGMKCALVFCSASNKVHAGIPIQNISKSSEEIQFTIVKRINTALLRWSAKRYIVEDKRENVLFLSIAQERIVENYLCLPKAPGKCEKKHFGVVGHTMNQFSIRKWFSVPLKRPEDNCLGGK